METPADVPSEVTGALLGGLAVFAELDGRARDRLAALAELREVPGGATFFREGEPSSEVMIVLAGRVSLSMHPPGGTRTAILTVNPGELVGWSGLLETRDRFAAARAVEPSRLVVFRGRELMELCESDHEIGYAVMRAAFAALAQRLHETRIQMLDVFRTKTFRG